MDKRPQRLAKNKTDLMPKNASCQRWDTLVPLTVSAAYGPSMPGLYGRICCAHCVSELSGLCSDTQKHAVPRRERVEA